MTDPTDTIALEQQQLEVDALRDVVLGALTDLEGHWPHLGSLVDSRQRGIGFLDADAKAAQDEMIRVDRAARYPGRQARPVGLKFLIPLHLVTASGDRPAPGNITAQSARSLIHRRLCEWATFLTALLKEQGICHIHGVPGGDQGPSTVDVMWHLGALVKLYRNVPDLETMADDFTRLADEAKRLIDGDDKKTHPDPCPWCGRLSLVVYLTKGVIRCEGDHSCQCSDPYCQCRYHHHRHEWHRQPIDKTQRSWWHLRDHLTVAERNRNDQGDQA